MLFFFLELVHEEADFREQIVHTYSHQLLSVTQV